MVGGVSGDRESSAAHRAIDRKDAEARVVAIDGFLRAAISMELRFRHGHRQTAALILQASGGRRALLHQRRVAIRAPAEGR
jgi:hypothetical protein